MAFGFGTVRPYQDTLRDKVALRLEDVLGRSPIATHFIDGLMGSTGLGHQHAGLIDWVPGLGQVFQADEAGRQIANGQPVAGALNTALAALPIPAAAKGLGFGFKKAAEVAEAAVGRRVAGEAAEVTAPIIAYHGSPHTFDQFDPAKIGSGEGAQAYGHGLYFAQNEDVAKGYRDRLAGEQATLGSMYQVGISAHPDHFLDWDQTLDRQAPHVRQALATVLGDDSLTQAAGRTVYDANSLGTPYDPRTGQSVYRALGAKQDAAKSLSEAGIAGIKYLDAGSRAAGDGTRNYVVFNPENIEIIKRYGLPALLGGGALAASAASPDQAQAAPAVPAS